MSKSPAFETTNLIVPQIHDPPHSLDTYFFLDQAQEGLPGKTLFQLAGSVRWYILGLVLYGVASIALAVYIATCPSPGDPDVRVLPTGTLIVDQFYAGLLFSCVLTPAAIIIRKVSTEIALLHPFAISSRKPAKLKELDLMLDPGVWSMLHLFKYDCIAALVQAVLIISGAALVPIGALLIFTGTFASSFQSTVYVGMPTKHGNSMTMNIEAELTPQSFSKVVSGAEEVSDFFLDYGIDMFAGNILRQSGVLISIPDRLGPSSTTNLTYKDGVEYNGIVTFGWSSGCAYTNAITFTESTSSDAWMFNITFPNGKEFIGEDSWKPQTLMTNTTNDNGTVTTYYATIGVNSTTSNFNAASEEGAITTQGGAWISRVA